VTALAPEGIIRLILDAYIVTRHAVVRRGLRVPEGRDLLVGQGAVVAGSISGGRHVHLAKAARVRGHVRAPLDVVVGAHARVEGDVEAGGNVYLLEGARVRGSLRAAGLVRVVGGAVEGPVRAGGDVEVRGEAVLTEIAAAGRVRTLPT
jgi:cytoskeletal protein CcmA (bactofilin family)